MKTRVGKRLRDLGGAVSTVILTVLLASCAAAPTQVANAKKRSKEFFAESEYGVKASPRVTNKRSNLPRGGGRDQLGKPYQVRGKWYYPKEDREYRKIGAASWYGDAFHGRLTANGEIYDMTHVTAAHPTMPLPSYARVTNLKNGNSIIVRVNDRGPYHSGRIIDLSRRAAEMLDYANGGMARVEVEYVGRARMDGRDEQYLLASYQPGSRVPDQDLNSSPTGVMVALEGNSPRTQQQPHKDSIFGTGPEVMDSAGEWNLPVVAPIAPERPEVAMAAMSYAPEQSRLSVSAFSAFEQHDTEHIVAGTFETLRTADLLAATLSAFGQAAVEESGNGSEKAFTVIVRPNGRLSGDKLLEATWKHGAPDAITVRD